ncbi:hypothetical protein LES60_04675 [Pectobacterium brasiliense]|uniref:hypothetical protein n=2 Tax=Pectobacterium brasiliense TaxID=180957 RepID=UPI001969E083|nr:hypothetical protein [Pectobacterium brasiliense]MBN3344173.1 hypothetical protein [Pectobacterium brasiliense]MCA5918505.1 hypothetical protein [Pectobacterium brasiliense]MCA5925956.1 hypothetical protein [Pectobacterium brasiliense]MCA5934369.1 hypothetical protein [Pectobacterium brasiliense]MCA5938551.1 hypothetical protein [Pectobacterium brasiliense]
MSKETFIENKSTEMFFDLAKRSFKASWEVLQEINGDSTGLLDDPDFMSPFIINVFDHIQRNFEQFTAQEGNRGDITEVNFEQVAAMLVRYSDSFRK